MGLTVPRVFLDSSTSYPLSTTRSFDFFVRPRPSQSGHVLLLGTGGAFSVYLKTDPCRPEVRTRLLAERHSNNLMSEVETL